MVRTTLVRVFDTGEGITRGEAGIGATLNAVIRSTTERSGRGAEGPRARGVANGAGTEESVIRFLTKKEGGRTCSIPGRPKGHCSAR
jgi:hypothetical protein